LCPLCKKEFKKIIYYYKNKKKEMKVKKKKLEVEEEGIEFYEYVEGSRDECMKCGQDNDFSNMLVCDRCHYNVCHTYCDGLSRIPDTDWFCGECRDSEARVNLFRGMLDGNLEYEEDDDEEYSPRIIVEDDEVSETHQDDLDDLLDLDNLENYDNAFILSREKHEENLHENQHLPIIQNRRPLNNNSNISLNIHVNFNMRRARNSRTNSNTSRSSNSNTILSNFNNNSNIINTRRGRNHDRNTNNNLNDNNYKNTRARSRR
jgi:hypothetical protein